ncbi:MAG: hypothetical protein WDZ59_07145 [Pirellulales bacterium]
MSVAAEPKQRFAYDADEVELQAIRGGVASVAGGAHDELISGEADEIGTTTAGAVPRWQEMESAISEIAGGALEVAGLRKGILGELYPFAIDGGGLVHSEASNLFYDYCLLTSVAASRPDRRHQSLVRHFERVVRDLLVAFVGGDAVGVRIGWPSEKDWDQLPKRMRRKVEWMKSLCGYDVDEWTFDTAKRLDAVRERAKDARIDVVVHRTHGDGRIGGITLLGQCGCGRGDVDSSSRKHEELSTAWLSHFFGRNSIPSGLRAFATSQHIVRSDDLYAKQSVADVMILDRIRLCILANDHPVVVDAHRDRIVQMMSDVLGPA